MIEIEFREVPVPMSRPRLTRSGRTYTPTLQKNYRDKFREQVHDGKHTMIHGPVQMIIHFYFPHQKKHGTWKDSRPDIDNLAKMTMDCIAWVERGTKIKRGVLHDDSQVVQLTATKQYCGKGERPRTVVLIRETEHDGWTEAERHKRKIKQLRTELEELRRHHGQR